MRRLFPRPTQITELFLPMRGYETVEEPNEPLRSPMLFLPMRGYEAVEKHIRRDFSGVISPHEGL